MRGRAFWLPIFSLALLFGGPPSSGVDTTPSPRKTSAYLALGDSYAVGTGVSPLKDFPHQLADELSSRGGRLFSPVLIAGEGWSTEDLIRALSKSEQEKTFDLVTLQIGANNHFKLSPLDKFQEDIRYLLWKAVKLAGNRPERVVILSIPDWSKTPFANDMNEDKIFLTLKDFNKSIRMMSQRAGVHFVDLSDVSAKAEKNPLLTAADGLHPSEKMISLWVEETLSVLDETLSPDKNF